MKIIKPVWVVSATTFLLFLFAKSISAQSNASAIVPATQKKEQSKSINSLPFSTPEAEGVSSAGILNFLDAVQKGRNELHSFVIIRHGKIISQGWWEPYAKDLKHVMFSVSKSFTSTGIGLAIAEKKLKLNDKVISFFPQSLPDTLSEYMKEMTVEHLLKMSTGMNTDPLFTARSSKDWPKAFLSAKVENKPGSVFKYNNMATFMLSAIVQKATGQKLFDYLKPRLFEPLGITNVTWDETPEGYTFGAIGMRIQSGDMAKFGQMLLQKGKWNGKQIVPQSWVEQATSFKINSNDPSNKTPKELNDWEQGYCYQFWRSRNNAYRADGLGGQFIIVLPEKDAVVVLTASATNTQEEMNLVWDYLLPAMKDKALPADKNALASLNKRIASLSVAKPDYTNASLLSKISGKKIEFAQNETGIKALTLSVKDGDAQLKIDRGNEEYELPAGKDDWKFTETKLTTLAPAPTAMGAPPASSQLPVKVASRYLWIDGSTVEWTSKFVEQSIGSETWALRFEDSDNELKVQVEIRGMRPRKLEGKIAGQSNTQNSPPGPRNPQQRRILSPELHNDGKVTFRLNAPAATEVSLWGEWQKAGEMQKMAKGDSGVWTLTVGPLNPEFHGYHFIVDGVQTLDPANARTKRDGVRYFNTFIIQGAESDLYTIKDVPHGTVSKVWYESPTLKLKRRMYVYTPPGYEDSKQNYPVFYLLHGGGGDEDAWTANGLAPVILDNLIAQGKAKPMIVVMTNGNPGETAAIVDRASEPPRNITGTPGPNPMSIASERFPESLVKDVIPYVEKYYRVVSNSANRAIAGLSMGCLHTQITVMNNPELFKYIGLFSLGLHDNLGETNTRLIAAYDRNLPKLKTNYKLMYVAVGKDDFVYNGVQTLRKKLDENNFKYTYNETSGGHTWANWRIYLSDLAPQLFK